MNLELNVAGTGGCDGCCIPSGVSTDPYTCVERRTVFTHREDRVFEKIRDARKAAQDVKRRLKAFEACSSTSTEHMERKAAAEEELGALRKLRSQLEEERLAAAEERMRLLGHLS